MGTNLAETKLIEFAKALKQYSQVNITVIKRMQLTSKVGGIVKLEISCAII